MPRNIPKGPVDARRARLPFLKPLTVTCIVIAVQPGPEERSPCSEEAVTRVVYLQLLVELLIEQNAILIRQLYPAY